MDFMCLDFQDCHNFVVKISRGRAWVLAEIFWATLSELDENEFLRRPISHFIFDETYLEHSNSI